MRGLLPPAALLVAAGLALGGCGEKPVSQPSPSPLTAVDVAASDLRSALEMAPADTDQVVFTAPARARARWGMSGLTSAAATPAQLNAYAAKMRTGAATTVLGPDIGVMSDWGWNGLDVDWEITLLNVGSEPVRLVKLRDSLDMAAVTKSLTAHGMKASSSTTGPGPQFTATGAGDQQYVSALSDGVTVLADKHMIALGEYTAIPAPDQSLAKHPAASRAVAAPESADYVEIAIGPSGCVPAGRFGTLSAITPSTGTDSAARVEYATPLATAAMVLNDTEQRATAVYPDTDTASAEKLPRQLLVSQGLSSANKPFITLIGARVAQQGTVLVYTMRAASGAVIPALVAKRDTPWAACGS